MALLTVLAMCVFGLFDWVLHLGKRHMAVFIAPRKLFQASVDRVCRIIPRRTDKDLLKNVRVSVNGHVELDAMSSTSEGLQSHHLVADWQRAGDATVLVNGKQLNDAAKLATGSEVIVNVSPDGISIGGITIPAYACEPVDPKVPEVLDSFPPIGCVVGSLAPIATVKIDAACLKAAIDCTEYASDTESTRYALGGIQFDFSGPGQLLRLVATDSRRLAVCEAGVYGMDETSPASVVVPNGVCRRLAMSLDKTEGSVVMTIFAAPPGNTTGPIRFVLPNGITVETDAVQGRFLDWRRVVPDSFSFACEVKRDEFAAATKTAMMATNENARGVDYHFRDAMIDATGSCESAKATGQCVTRATATWVPEVKATFDPRYFLDFLKSCDKKQPVTISLVDHETPAVLSQGSTKYIVMPLSRDR